MSLKGGLFPTTHEPEGDCWVVDHRRMIVTLHTDRLRTLQHVREFLEGNQEVDLVVATRAAAYGFIEQTLGRFDYVHQGKAEKGLLRCFLAKVTGLSRAQLTRLLAQHRPGASPTAAGRPDGRSPAATRASTSGFSPSSTGSTTLSGPATRKLCARAYHRFGDRRFERLAGISNGHLYNLRHSTTYQRRRGTTSTRTRPVQVAIGERRRPTPFGRPGYVRVDSVHQADLDDLKGLYHVNLVDEVTQFQFIGSVEHLHAACLAPVLSALLRAFPFTLHGFHSDNGSEYVNRRRTPHRVRPSPTQRALVESKNGSSCGYGHIPSRQRPIPERALLSTPRAAAASATAHDAL